MTSGGKVLTSVWAWSILAGMRVFHLAAACDSEVSLCGSDTGDCLLVSQALYRTDLRICGGCIAVVSQVSVMLSGAWCQSAPAENGGS